MLLASGSAGWTAPKKGGPGSPEGQLYDMEADPGETNNLYKSNPEVVDRLLAQLTAYVEEGRSTEGPGASNDVPVKIWKGKK